MILNLVPLETAEVDSEYECIGFCNKDVILVPEVDLSFAVKGVKSYPDDDVESLQHTMYLSYESPPVGYVGSEFFASPGGIYKKDGVHYIEAGYKSPVGNLTMNVYFLVDVKDCSFGVKGDEGEIVSVIYDYLWDQGLIIKAGS